MVYVMVYLQHGAAVTIDVTVTPCTTSQLLFSVQLLVTSAALSLAVGVIFYISAVNDEVSHRKKAPSSSSAGVSFTYRYGWAFFFAGASFMCAMVAAVNNISLYLQRGIDIQDTDNNEGRTSTTAAATVDDGRGSAADAEKGLTNWRQQQHQLHHANITTPV